MRKTKSSPKLDLVVRSGSHTSRPSNRPRWPHPAIAVSRAGEHLSPQTTPFDKTVEHLSTLLEAAGIVMWEADAEDFEFTFVSEEAVKLIGYEAEQWYGHNFFASHIHPDDRERVLGIRWRRHQPAKHYDFEFRMVAKDQHIVWIRGLVEVVDGCRMRGFMIDITDRKQVEETLRELGGRLISAQEEERSRVARELHDDVNQRMALLSIQLEQLQQDQEKTLDLSERFQNLKVQVQEISNDIHRLSYRLHPSKLDHLGLGPAVKSLCAELTESGKLQIDFQQARVPASLPKDVTLCVFRIAQEALGNCIKHSGAQTVEVMLEKTNNEIHLSVSDNGSGFDQESERTRKGLGFISMRERLRLVDGCIHIHTRPRLGTRVEVSVPLTRGVERGDLKEVLPAPHEDRLAARHSEPLTTAVSF
ncbi:MAG TPA: PAS domain-containing protein [Pyrinomonadaceae bacterium]|nr:PAS domain-containing protein [Pyrinomonadaceae bacterium]